jgi:hypothetical protein
MHFFHPRSLSTQPLQSALEPRSEWAKAHAIEFAQMGEGLTTISDSRTIVINFLRAVEAAMGQACITVEWVAEGGANQVCCPFSLRVSLRCKHKFESSCT